MKKIFAGIAIAAFVALVLLANYATDRFGLVELPFGLAATAGTFAAGAVLIARDVVHGLAGRLAVVGCIAVGAALSGALSPAFLALASAVAFLLAELVDWTVYEPMRRRGWGRAVIASSIVAAPVDTIIFLWLAPFPVTLDVVLGQTIVKVSLALLIVVVARALLRDRFEPAHS